MTASKSLVFQCDGVEIREQEYCVVRGGEVFPVEPRAFQVLVYLLRNPRRLIKKEELLQAVWGDVAVTENSLARAILKLRQILEDDARSPRYIETVPRIGYRFIGSVAIQMDRAPSKTEDHGLAVVEEGGNGTLSVSPDAGSTMREAEPPSLVSRATSIDAHVTRSTGRTVWRWPLGIGAALFLILGGVFWYLSRPLPPPKITAYTQLTHDGRSKQLAGTDGSRLYFTQLSPNLLAQISVKGGEVAPLPITIPGAEAGLADLSPDASQFVAWSWEEGRPDGSLWITSTLGGSIRRLGSGGHPSFSPDGSSVIYATVKGNLSLVRTDGTGTRELASVAPPAGRFQWSPEGKRIRFSNRDGLWEMGADGTGLHRILTGWKGIYPPCCGAWTRDGQYYIFLADGQLWALDERHDVFRHSPPTPTQLTSGPISWDAPVPGRDEKTLFVAGVTPKGELSRVDPTTGNPQPFLGGISAETVAFSPDGKYVAYVSYPEGIVWRADRDGGNTFELSHPPGHALNPQWSRDSSEIVYTTTGPDGRDSIRRVSAADGNPLWLLPGEKAEMHDATWSPDGRKVLFGAGEGGGFNANKRELRIIDVVTHEVTVVPGSEQMWSPRWSPNGRYILALRGTEKPMFLFDFSTQKWRTLPVEGDGEFPSFSHDGRFVYYLRYGRDQGIYRIPVEGGKEERVVQMTDWHLTGYLNFSMSLDPTDAALVLRDTGTDDIYALTLEVK